MQYQGIPDRPLVVRCTFERSNKQIKFASARNCTFALLLSRVEQCFSLSQLSYDIQYRDDNGEDYKIDTDETLEEAIRYFQHGSDDPPHSSAASILSGRSFGSRKIVLRVHVVVEYDGPSLSDSSSLAGSDEYQGRNGSQISLSFSGQSQDLLDDDSITVSSRDAGITPYQAKSSGKTRSPSTPSKLRNRTSREEGTSSFASVHIEDSMSSPGTDPFADPSVTHSSSQYAASRQLSDEYISAATRFPAVSAVFEHLRIQDSSHESQSSIPGRSPLHGDNRNAAWIRDQNERVIRSKLGNLPEPSISDGSSVEHKHEVNLGQLAGGDLELRQNPRGKYYYDYTSVSGSSQTHDSGFEDVMSSCDTTDNVSNVDSKPRVSSMSLTWVADQQISMRNGLRPESSHRSNFPSHHSDPLPNSREYIHIDPETPPEVLQFVPVKPPHPDQLTDCSQCGKALDSMRYVCKNCGEKSPTQFRTLEKGKGKGKYPNGGSTPYQFCHHTSYSSPDISFPIVPNESASSSYGMGIHAQKPLPALPYGSGPLSYLAFTTPDLHADPDFGSGYELCAGCIEHTGVTHAIDVATSTSGRANSIPSSPEDVSEWTRSAPRQKGQLRHSFLEKSWGHRGWVDVEQDNCGASECSTCGSTILFKQHYKCFSCAQINLCRACYSQVHMIHPAHTFLYVSEKPQQALSETDLHPAETNHLSEESSLSHTGVKCAHCMLGIVGARFHCAVCESFDTCSKCDSAGAFNLDSSDGGHVSSHIMIKLPNPVESSEIRNASRKALNLWTRRDAATVQRSTARPRTTSMVSSSDARTVITSSTRVPSIARSNHQVRCNSCGMDIIGVRYQCASCSSLTTPFSLCEGCEVTSYSRHNPMHFFFKLPRPVQRPLKLHSLPNVYITPAGSMTGIATRDPTEYLRNLKHSNAVCDRCVTPVHGAWFRCAYCGKDLCDSCEELDTHDDTHVFLLFKSMVDHNLLGHITDLDRPTNTPVIPYAVYQ